MEPLISQKVTIKLLFSQMIWLLSIEKFGGVFSANQTLSTGNYCLISTTQLSDTTFAATDSISTSGGILSANVHHFLTGAGCVIGVLFCLTVALSIVLCYKYVKKLNQSDTNCGLNICNGNITIETKCARDKAGMAPIHAKKIFMLKLSKVASNVVKALTGSI